VVLLIGDFTATIGDPTDKTSARVKLSRQQVLQNAHDYQQQASKILDFTSQDNPAELRYNSEWLGKMGFADVLELASEFTVQQMLERDMFKRRMANNKPVGLHEFLYPIMQGWDSVCLDVDIEVGGSDQIFNMLVGSTLVKRHKNRQKFVIAGDLLVDPSGKKIGKTEGNMITLNDEPLDMFHKIMMWGDGITPHALELCSNLPMSQIEDIAAKLKSGELSGLDGKMFLAKTIVTGLHGAEAAAEAEKSYHALTSKEAALDKESFTATDVSTSQNIVDVLVASGLASSKSQARRLLSGKGVRVNGKTVDESWFVTEGASDAVLQVGKKKHENHRLMKLKK
jgi:tyrosyl-tRNA synthetase